MDITVKLAIALGVFFVLIAGGFAVMVFVADGGALGGGEDTRPAGPKKQMEDEILVHMEVVEWRDNIPTVRFYDSGASKMNDAPVVQALQTQMQNAVGGPSGTRLNPETVLNEVDAAYHLGMVHEHGLFGQPVNIERAKYCYQQSLALGNVSGDFALERLNAPAE